MHNTDAFTNVLIELAPERQINSIDPVFIIGSYRSGTSVLTWALGQHSNIFPLEETNWIYRMGVYADSLYGMGTANGLTSHLSNMEMTRSGFYKSLGRFINSFVLDTRLKILKTSVNRHLKNNNLPPIHFDQSTTLSDFAAFSDDSALFAHIRKRDDTKNRWIDGTPENSHFVYCLNLLFPNAKFICLIRNPIKVANSLMNFSSVNGETGNYEEENAYNQWYTLTESCHLALKAFGTKKILLIQQEDLASQKETVIAKCLSFLHEPYDANCLKPLEATINSSKYDKTGIDFSISNGIESEKEYKAKACQLYNQVLNDTYSEKGSLHYYRLLRDRYLEHARHFK